MREERSSQRCDSCRGSSLSSKSAAFQGCAAKIEGLGELLAKDREDRFWVAQRVQLL